MSVVGRLGGRLSLGALGCLLAVSACDPDASSAPVAERIVPNATVRLHAVEASTPTPEGLAYLQAVAQVHAQADGLLGSARVRVLRQGLALPKPAGVAEAEILRLDLAARLGEELLATGDGAWAARNVVAPLVPIERSLPLDRATARALVVLGDAAAKTGDDALAVGSYARSLEVMSALRQELEP